MDMTRKCSVTSARVLDERKSRIGRCALAVLLAAASCRSPARRTGNADNRVIAYPPACRSLADIRGRVGGDQQDPFARRARSDRGGAGEARLPEPPSRQEQEPRRVVHSSIISYQPYA